MEDSYVYATGLFGVIWRNIPREIKVELKYIFVPCLDVFFQIRNDTVKSLTELAEEAKITVGICDTQVKIAGGTAGGFAALGSAASCFRSVAFLTPGLGTVAAVACGALVLSKGNEYWELNKLAGRFTKTFSRDCKACAELNNCFSQFFQLNEDGRAQVKDFIEVSARNGVFNSTDEANQFMSLISVLSNDDSMKHAGEPDLYTFCLDFIQELSERRSLSKGTRENIRKYLEDRRKAAAIMGNFRKELKEHSDNSPSSSLRLNDLMLNMIDIPPDTLEIFRHLFKKVLFFREDSITTGLENAVRDLEMKLKILKIMYNVIKDA